MITKSNNRSNLRSSSLGNYYFSNFGYFDLPRVSALHSAAVARVVSGALVSVRILFPASLYIAYNTERNIICSYRSLFWSLTNTIDSRLLLYYRYYLLTTRFFISKMPSLFINIDLLQMSYKNKECHE